jgi:hypothetical protein
LQRALSVLRHFKKARAVLFDSFRGLPEPVDRADAHVTWHAEDFAFSSEYIRGVIKKARFPQERVRLVEGFYADTLTLSLAAELRPTPPAFVTLDVDYRSSTKAALDFLAPLLPSGCHVFFDDLWSFDGHPDYGQLKALNDWNSQNKRGQLVPSPIFHDRIYTYFNWHYEFAAY